MKAFDINSLAETHKTAKNVNLVCLIKTFEVEKPLAKLIRTESGYYLYDTGTNKIMICPKEVYDLLNGLLSKPVNQAIEGFISDYGKNKFLAAANEIIEAINKEKFFQVKKASRFGLSGHFKNFEERD